jgi:UDP-N-acetylglucosamine acyltransferase
MNNISNLAYVHPNAQLGENITVAPFATIEKDVIIGDNCWIGPNSVLMSGSRIGHSCKVFPGAVIGADPQDLKYKGEYTTVEIGNHTVIRECATLHRGTADKEKSTVGDHCLIMAYVHLAHDVEVGNNCIIANSAGIAGHAVIQDNVVIEGGGVSIQQFTIVGQHSFIAGGAMVRKDIPPFIRVARDPLQYVGVNKIGMQRRGFKEGEIKTVEDIYRLIFVLNKNLSNGIQAVKDTVPDSKLKDIILEFIANSPAGIVKGV